MFNLYGNIISDSPADKQLDTIEEEVENLIALVPKDVKVETLRALEQMIQSRISVVIDPHILRRQIELRKEIQSRIATMKK